MHVKIGFCLFILFYLLDPKSIKVELSKVASFVGLLALLICWKIHLHVNINAIQPIHTELDGAIKADLFFVFLEDCFYVLPIFMLDRIMNYFKDLPIKYKKVMKFLRIILILSMSLLFGSGHLYQGIISATIISLYPYFISYRLGLKYGLGTVMVCHILWDFVQVYSYDFISLIKTNVS